MCRSWYRGNPTNNHKFTPDAQYEYFTHVKDDDVHDDDDDDKTTINDEDFVDRDKYEERIEWGEFERDIERDIDDDEIFYRNEPNANNVISVQNIMNTILAYALPAMLFSTNTWENMVDPLNIEISFVSTWRGD